MSPEALRTSLSFTLLLILSMAMAPFSQGSNAFVLYAIKFFVVSALLVVLYWRYGRELRGRLDWKALGIGILVFAVWVLPDLMCWSRPPEGAAPFDPSGLQEGSAKYLLLGVRLLGASLMIPIVEELFFRSFLMRVLINPDIRKVQIGTYSHVSFWGSAIVFAFFHDPSKWVVALITSSLYGAYLVREKNFFGCIIAHGVTNLALGIYVLATDSWWLW